jgi:phosphoribosyl 1,2-cyclic phosphodiesterase
MSFDIPASYKKISINGTPWSLLGNTVEHQYISFNIDEIDICIGAGIRLNRKVKKFIFIPNYQYKYFCALYEILLDAAANDVVATVVCPAYMERFLSNWLFASIKMSKFQQAPKPIWNLIAINDTEPCFLTISKKRFRIVPIICDDRYFVGFGFTEVRQKLKAELQGLPQASIELMKKSGKEIVSDHIYPLFCYVPDISMVHEDLSYYNTIITDKTFYDSSYDDTSITSITLYNCVPIAGTDYTLTGDSWAADHTGFIVPELGINLDAGFYFDSEINILKNQYIFITHGHYDHMRDIYKILMNAQKMGITMTIVVPQALKSFLHEWLLSTFRLCSCNYDVSPFWNIISIGYDAPIYLPIADKNFKIEPFKCTHSVPCCGYGFVEILGSGEEKQHFCYVCDTDHRVMAHTGEKSEIVKLGLYKSVIIECTFLKEEDVKHAKQDKHMHWKYLKQYAISHSEQSIIAMHFSTRYKIPEIIAFFKSERIGNVLPFITKLTKTKVTVVDAVKVDAVVVDAVVVDAVVVDAVVVDAVVVDAVVVDAVKVDAVKVDAVVVDAVKVGKTTEISDYDIKTYCSLC